MSKFVPTKLRDLELMVQEHIEETASLEFKRELPESGKNDDLARLLAAMANSGGGVIVYGIEDEDSRAAKLVPMLLADSEERVTLVAQSLDDPLSLEAVSSVPAEPEGAKGFLVVSVPASERAPHFHRGTAWGRSPKGTVALSRRAIGELYARQPGFAQEFGLISTRPGRVICRHIAEANPNYSPSNGTARATNYFLVFENDGDEDALGVDWEWAIDSGEEPPILLSDNPFPLEAMRRGERLRLGVAHTLGSTSNLRVRTRWRDGRGSQHEEVWPLTF